MMGQLLLLEKKNFYLSSYYYRPTKSNHRKERCCIKNQQRRKKSRSEEEDGDGRHRAQHDDDDPFFRRYNERMFRTFIISLRQRTNEERRQGRCIMMSNSRISPASRVPTRYCVYPFLMRDSSSHRLLSVRR